MAAMGVKIYAVVIVRLTNAGKDTEFAHDEEVVESGGAQTRGSETIDLESSDDDESDMAGMRVQIAAGMGASAKSRKKNNFVEKQWSNAENASIRDVNVLRWENENQYKLSAKQRAKVLEVSAFEHMSALHVCAFELIYPFHPRARPTFFHCRTLDHCMWLADALTLEHH